MSAESIAKALLEANASVVSLVGSRIYLDARPEGDPLPAVVFGIISEVDELPVGAVAGQIPTMARVQVNCQSATAAGRKTLADAVVAAGDRKSGSIASTTVMSVFTERGPSSYSALVATFEQPVDYLIRYMR